MAQADPSVSYGEAGVGPLRISELLDAAALLVMTGAPVGDRNAMIPALGAGGGERVTNTGVSERKVGALAIVKLYNMDATFLIRRGPPDLDAAGIECDDSQATFDRS